MPARVWGFKSPLAHGFDGRSAWRGAHFRRGGHADPGVDEPAVRCTSRRSFRLAQRLQAHGHDVVVTTEPAFGATVRSHRLEPVPVGRNLTLEDVLAVLPDIFVVPPEEQDAYTAAPSVRRVPRNERGRRLARLRGVLEAGRHTAGNPEFAGWAVGTRLEIPQVSVNVGGATSAEEWQAFAEPWFTTLARHVGLTDLPVSSLYHDGVVAFEPAGFNDWSSTPTARVFQPEPVAADDPLPADFVALGERPLVYATLGTEFYNAELMASIVAALHASEWNIVATTGPQGDPAAVDPDAPNVFVTQWIAQDTVLDRAAAVVSHTGAGAVTGCLVRGIPSVCVPLGADQFHNAGRVEELGAGIVLPPERRSLADIRGAVDSVVADPAYATAARRIASETARLPDVDTAVAFVEEAVVTRRG